MQSLKVWAGMSPLLFYLERGALSERVNGVSGWMRAAGLSLFLGARLPRVLMTPESVGPSSPWGTPLPLLRGGGEGWEGIGPLSGQESGRGGPGSLPPSADPSAPKTRTPKPHVYT